MADEPQMTTIEVHGVKMEVDLRTARRVEEIRVGTRVKVLTKTYSGHAVYHGVVIGFEPFKELPTIVVAYIKRDYNKVELDFLHYNTATKEIEIVKAVDDDILDLDREEVEQFFNRQIASKEREIADLEEKRAYFNRHFAQFWENVERTPERPKEDEVQY